MMIIPPFYTSHNGGSTEEDPTMADSERGAALLAAEAVRTDGGLADVQYEHSDGVIDLTWGHPDPSTFAAADIAAAAAVTAEKWQSLTYGFAGGAGYTRAAIAAHLSATDCPTAAEDVIVTAGSSGGLDLLLTVLARPGDVVFVEQPTYFLALRMFADHGLRIVGLGSDADGPLVDEFAAAATAATADGRTSFLYVVPTFANPTGRCMPPQRQRALLDAAATTGTYVIDDDAYRDTAAAAPPSMWSLDHRVLRLGSFSKSLSPGLRVGYLTTDRAMVERIAGCGLLDSGGGVNHFASMMVGELLRTGRFREIAAAAAARYASRRAALAGAIDPSLFTFTVPDGGYFLWLGLPKGVDTAQAVAAAKANGVLVANGRNFCVDEPSEGFVRVSFSMLDEGRLADGARRLNQAVAQLQPTK
jgi:DNA-binding transcriptional MocR family regulator